MTEDAGGTKFTLTWAATASDGGCAITKYRITVKQINGVYSETSECNGADATVISTRTCEINEATIMGSPWGYTDGDLFIARVEVENAVGWSLPSDPNTTGVTVSS